MNRNRNFCKNIEHWLKDKGRRAVVSLLAGMALTLAVFAAPESAPDLMAEPTEESAPDLMAESAEESVPDLMAESAAESMAEPTAAHRAESALEAVKASLTEEPLLAWWGTLYPKFCFSEKSTEGEVKISFWLAKVLDW